MLSWITYPDMRHGDGLVPFLIDWADHTRDMPLAERSLLGAGGDPDPRDSPCYGTRH